MKSYEVYLLNCIGVINIVSALGEPLAQMYIRIIIVGGHCFISALYIREKSGKNPISGVP
jgi:hypothetical protein